MTDDTLLSFDLPAVHRKKLTVDFEVTPRQRFWICAAILWATSIPRASSAADQPVAELPSHRTGPFA
jgi:hypothetical protein